MDYIFEKSWSDLLSELSENFGEKLDYPAILMLIGLQELGKDYQTFKKDQKLELMHIGICAVLMPFGYYHFEGRDEEGWPHFTRREELPPLEPQQQELLIKKAILHYFKGTEED